MSKSFIAFIVVFSILGFISTFEGGCSFSGSSSSTPSTPSTTQPSSISGITTLKQELLVANGIATDLYQGGFINSSEFTTFNGIYGAASSALTVYSTDLSNGDQPGADIALAAFNGYFQQLSQKTSVGKVRKASNLKAPTTAPVVGVGS